MSHNLKVIEVDSEVIAREKKQAPEQLYYLSFAKRRFLGGDVVRAHGIFTALVRCKELNINPGGEVLAWPIEKKDEWRVPPDLRDRLLSEADVLERLDGKRISEP